MSPPNVKAFRLIALIAGFSDPSVRGLCRPRTVHFVAEGGVAKRISDSLRRIGQLGRGAKGVVVMDVGLAATMLLMRLPN